MFINLLIEIVSAVIDTNENLEQLITLIAQPYFSVFDIMIIHCLTKGHISQTIFHNMFLLMLSCVKTIPQIPEFLSTSYFSGTYTGHYLKGKNRFNNATAIMMKTASVGLTLQHV